MQAAIAGGVGAAKFLEGVARVVGAASVTAVVNTADDDVFHGLHVSPDLDSVTYRLAGASDTERGWGLADETYTTLESLSRYGEATWFKLGDRDLATHIFRTRRLREGASLSEVTAEITRAWNVDSRLLPMTDDRVRTMLTLGVRPDTGEPGDSTMQEWFVRDRTEPTVTAVRFEGADDARPAPGVLDTLATAESILICPSNPVISTAPVLAVPGIRDALVARRARVAAVSPIVGGRAVRGPADRLMASVGEEASCVGVARLYADICSTFVVDTVDASSRAAIEALGMRVVVTDTIMSTPDVSASLARQTLETLG